jgi:hypothetical protein
VLTLTATGATRTATAADVWTGEPVSSWSWFWLSWVAAGVAAELYVVAFGQRAARLSQSVWRLQDALPGQPIIWRLMVAALLVVLAWHLSFGPRH